MFSASQDCTCCGEFRCNEPFSPPLSTSHHPQRPKPKKLMHAVHHTMHPEFLLIVLSFFCQVWVPYYTSICSVGGLHITLLSFWSFPCTCLQAVPIFCTPSWQTKVCQASPFLSPPFSLHATPMQPMSISYTFSYLEWHQWCRICHPCKKTWRQGCHLDKSGQSVPSCTIFHSCTCWRRLGIVIVQERLLVTHKSTSKAKYSSECVEFFLGLILGPDFSFNL